MRDRAEIVVCGASLAGISAAIRLKQLGYDPLVLDRDRFPRPKLCGEFLGPDAFPCLQTLGVFEAVKEAAYDPVRRAMFYSHSGKSLEVQLSWISRKMPYGLAIPREKFDALLIRHAREMGIEVVEGCRVLPGIHQENDELFLQAQAGDDGSEMATVATRIVIDATGRHGGLFLQKGPSAPSQPQTRVKNMIGLQCHARTSVFDDSHLRMYFFPGGYGGIQPIAPGEINICLLTRFDESDRHALTDRLKFLKAKMSQNPVAAQVLETCAAYGELHATGNLNLNLRGDEANLLQVGDAMITIDPFTGSGMAHALETGLLAAEVIAEGARARGSYREMCLQYETRYRKKFGLRFNLLKMFRPVLFSGALQRWSWPVIRPALPALTAVFR